VIARVDLIATFAGAGVASVALARVGTRPSHRAIGIGGASGHVQLADVDGLAIPAIASKARIAFTAKVAGTGAEARGILVAPAVGKYDAFVQFLTRLAVTLPALVADAIVPLWTGMNARGMLVAASVIFRVVILSDDIAI